LFGSPTVEEHGKFSLPKCKSELSRKEAFSLLNVICLNNEKEFFNLLKLIYSNHTNNQYRNFVFSPSSGSRSKTGYVGLNNL
jgi:hypothetical protein